MPDHFERLKSALADRYAIDREIDRGGMATVFLARDVKHDRHVAIKVLHPEIAASVGHERFLREIQIAARLEHPNILTLIDSGEAGGLPYFVMPYLEGGSLRDRLDREGELPIEEALQIAAEVADGLDYAHEKGVVHRDIKPSNILLYRGHALVADFGIARALDLAGSGATVTGLAVGTPKYMSPEQAAGKADIDGRSDVYGLACVLGEMLAGEAPYDGPTPHAILARKVTEDTPSVRIRRRTVTRELENVLAKAMAQSPADRFATAGEFAKALKTRGAGVRRPRRMTAAQRKRLAIGAAAVAVLAIAGFAYWQVRPPADEPVALDEAVVVFLPFEEQGEIEGALDGDSIATDLSLLFGATGQYQARLPGDVRAAVKRTCAAGVSDICAPSVARALGAGLYVTGRVTTRPGDSIQVLAEMVDITGERAIPAVTVEGSRDDPRLLQHELLRALWLAPVAEGERGVRLADRTTDSPEALAAFLEGERLFQGMEDTNLRGSAVQYFERAVEIDSTFALAWHRLANVHHWNGRTLRAMQATDRAHAFSDRLSDHDRRMLEALRPHMAGQIDEAEAIYREILDERPDDVEALYGLGQLYWAYTWRHGRSIVESEAPLRRVVELSPSHSTAAAYLQFPLAAQGKLDAMDSVAGNYPFIEHRVAIRIFRALEEGDTAALQVAIDLHRDSVFGGSSTAGLLKQYWTSGRVVPDLDLQERLLRHNLDSDYLAERGITPGWIRAHRYSALTAFAYLEAGSGRWTSSRSFATAADSLQHWPAVPDWAFLAIHPFHEPSDEDAAWLRSRIEAYERPARVPVDSLHLAGRYWTVAPIVHPYLMGLLAARDGDYATAREYARTVETVPSPPRIPTMSHDLGRGLRADVLYREGRFSEALEILDEAEWQVSYMDGWLDPFAAGYREAALRARIFHALGRFEEALRYYEFTTTDANELAPAHLYRGEIYEAMGDTAQALWHYEAFAELWKDADPELMVTVREVLQHVAELRGEDIDVAAAGS
jgi:tetratricopeptide (TPR) repeat protein/tRNA A-37 threonylcarbamoyl transferase component Bud32